MRYSSGAQAAACGIARSFRLTDPRAAVRETLVLVAGPQSGPAARSAPGHALARVDVEFILMNADERKNQIFESACDEGNYALTSMLAGARALEREERRGDWSRR